MGKMIPPFYDNKITSDGEKKFFHALKQLDDKFVILHSLGIAQHQEKVFGEIDFVILCEHGILCLEVKGGFVTRNEGIWYFIDRYGKETGKAEGPFRQVFTAMLSLRLHLKEHFGPGNPISSCQYACGVIFPDMPFTQKGPEIIPDIIFDARNTLEDIAIYIEKVFGYWRNEVNKKHGFVGNKLTVAQIVQLEGYLRGDFGFVPSLGYIVEKTEEKLLTLTREQIDRLAIAGENPRILMKGGAGTGKTLLSIEHARRCAITGKKVLYLCFNRNLSRYLGTLMEKNDPVLVENLKVNNFHSYIYNELKANEFLPPSSGVDNETFYTEDLPETFLQLTGQPWYKTQYDVLIIDEGQDLMRFEYIICLDVMLCNGLKNGKWHFCYDPNQNIYNQSFEDALSLLMEYNPTLLTLDTNCRNTRPVGIFNTLLTGTPPSKFFRVDGESVTRESYKDFTDERKKLLKIVKRMIGQGIRPGSICLLSKVKFENSCLQGENIFKGICSFQNATDLPPHYLVENTIKFCTIQGFKGLEAPVVMLLDVDGFMGLECRQLNYTAMSRATSLLYIFYNAKNEGELYEMIKDSTQLLDIIRD